MLQKALNIASLFKLTIVKFWVYLMGLDSIVNRMAKVALVAGGIYAAVQLTPMILPYYASTSTQLAVAAAGGAGVGYVVANAKSSK